MLYILLPNPILRGFQKKGLSAFTLPLEKQNFIHLVCSMRNTKTDHIQEHCNDPDRFTLLWKFRTRMLLEIQNKNVFGNSR